MLRAFGGPAFVTRRDWINAGFIVTCSIDVERSRLGNSFFSPFTLIFTSVVVYCDVLHVLYNGLSGMHGKTVYIQQMTPLHFK